MHTRQVSENVTTTALVARVTKGWVRRVSEYSIGPGVQAAMADHGDEPRSDEVFVVNVEGSKISQTYGRDNVWYWLQEDNAVRALPFR